MRTARMVQMLFAVAVMAWHCGTKMVRHQFDLW